MCSCIAIHAKTFRSIYGFPKRQAAEDFYLLNKAVKVGPVQYSDTKTLTIRGRPSDRVPFGTGQGMKLIADQDLQSPLYHPRIFIELKKWIVVLKTASDEELIARLQEIGPDYPYYAKIQKVIKQPCPLAQRIRRRFVFFDCFQTMRWIHHMRDEHYPSIPIEDALYESPFIHLAEKPHAIRKHLRRMDYIAADCLHTRDDCPRTNLPTLDVILQVSYTTPAKPRVHLSFALSNSKYIDVLHDWKDSQCYTTASRYPYSSDSRG